MISLPSGILTFRDPAPVSSLLSVQAANKILLRLDPSGKVTVIDPQLRSTLGRALWDHLFAAGVEVATDPEDPQAPPNAYCEAAVRVVEALAPVIWPQQR
jgi:hypothetical protein